MQWQRPLSFHKPPGAEIGSKKHAVNHHSYCCQLNADSCDVNGDPLPGTEEHCKSWHENGLNVRVKDAENYGGLPLFMSEFGSCSNTEACAREINQIIELCEERLIGWAYWQYKNFRDFTTQTRGDGSSEGYFNPDGSI